MNPLSRIPCLGFGPPPLMMTMTAAVDEPSANLGAVSGEIPDHKEGDGRDEEERPLDGAVEREGASVRACS